MRKTLIAAVLLTVVGTLGLSACGDSQPKTIVVTKTAQPETHQMTGAEALDFLEATEPGSVTDQCGIFVQAADAGISMESLRASFVEGWNQGIGSTDPELPDPNEVYDAFIDRCLS